MLELILGQELSVCEALNKTWLDFEPLGFNFFSKNQVAIVTGKKWQSVEVKLFN